MARNKVQGEALMGNVSYTAMAAAVATAMTTGTACAAKKCDIVGSFTDTLGSTGKFTSETKGKVDNTVICADPYKLTVTKLTEKVINVKGKTKGNACGALTGDFTFQDGGCTSAAGTVTIAGLGSFPDTITRQGNAEHHAPVDTSALTTGLK